jgi:hypothetical protein
MIATIEHVWRRLKELPLAKLAIVVIVVRIPADPARRTTGYVGILPVPAPVAAPSSVAKNDQPVDQARRELRAARGRVLYAEGHAPPATTQRAERKATCPDRRVGQTKSSSTSPNS